MQIQTSGMLSSQQWCMSWKVNAKTGKVQMSDYVIVTSLYLRILKCIGTLKRLEYALTWMITSIILPKLVLMY